jgi:hypothetical protein
VHGKVFLPAIPCSPVQLSDTAQLAGSSSTVIADMPDGDWELIMRRDIFRKSSGAVRDWTALQAVAYYYRVYIAAVSVAAEQGTEALLLQRAVNVSGQPLMSYIAANLGRVRELGGLSVPAEHISNALLKLLLHSSYVCCDCPTRSNRDHAH